MKPAKLTNGLIANLNAACATLRDEGKCGDEYECYCIGWCSDAWRIVDEVYEHANGKRAHVDETGKRDREQDSDNGKQCAEDTG